MLKVVFLMFPNYCLGRGLMDIAFNEYHNEFYFKTGKPSTHRPVQHLGQITLLPSEFTLTS
jgi:hypothetical protein